MTAWRILVTTLVKNPISTFAVLCVASTAAFLGYMTLRMSNVLESSDWCGKAIQAEKISPGSTYVGLTTCVELLKIQLQAIATGFHISVGSFALTLIVLIVVVIAGARATFKAGAGGIEGSMERDDPGDENPKSEAAKEVAGAAVDKAKEIVAEEKLPPMQPKP